MGFPRTIKFTFLFLFLLPGLLNGQSKKIDYKIETGLNSVRIVLPATYSISLIKIPAFAPTIWGKSNKCTLSVFKSRDYRQVSALQKQNSSIHFENPTGLFKSFELIPVAFSPPTTDELPTNINNAKPIEIFGTSEKLQAVEDELYRLSIETFNFNQSNNCFSCHTSYPLFKACNEAVNRGLKVPTEKLIAIGKQIQEFQNSDGSFFFSSNPIYGKISTSLCAGAILAMASRYSVSFLHPLKKLFNIMPLWQTKSGQLDSDFLLPPLFLGKMTSKLFESMIISALFYSPVAIPEISKSILRQRLVWLQSRKTNIRKIGTLKMLMLLQGIPYLFQFSPEEVEEVRNKIIFMQNDAAIKNSHILNSIFLSVARSFAPDFNPSSNFKQLISGASTSLSKRIWSCFVRTLNAY